MLCSCCEKMRRTSVVNPFPSGLAAAIMGDLREGSTEPTAGANTCQSTVSAQGTLCLQRAVACYFTCISPCDCGPSKSSFVPLSSSHYTRCYDYEWTHCVCCAFCMLFCKDPLPHVLEASAQPPPVVRCPPRQRRVLVLQQGNQTAPQEINPQLSRSPSSILGEWTVAQHCACRAR